MHEQRDMSSADLAPLLLDPALASQVPPEQVPPLLCQLAALQTVLAARLTGSKTETDGAWEDRLLTVDQAAERLSVTRDWLRRRPELPFVVKLSEGVVRYSARGLERFIATHRQK